ncbi:helix-turn-helix domain-containing protein [Halobacillus rhizosphaerae]|uniref:PucR family transcriptional regulator n=1 Tax=Halobacillus rhizosphaerae TaxID=3064889 RepID=UPI00398A91D9
MSIISELKDIYPSLIQSTPQNEANFDDYFWYQTNDMETIGILRIEMTNRESQMLQTFLSPLLTTHLVETEREKEWASYLFGKEETFKADSPGYYRFVFFSIGDDTAQRDTIREALQSLFPSVMPIIWENDQSGFIVEEAQTLDDDPISFQNVIDVLMSDFYTSIKFFVSEFSADLKEAPAIFEWSRNCFEKAKQHRIGSVVTYQDMIPYLFINSLSEEDSNHIVRSVFKQVIDDRELLQTVQVFLESGSNASLAAKNLFMHRNSLQYRVDKFIEKTGIDVKDFKGALTTYLALMKLKR